MDFLFDNPLATMYGPFFLVFYAVFNLTTLAVFLVLKKRLDKTDRYVLPPIPSDPDPYEIAFLRGGKNELARSVVFALVQKNFLKIVNAGKSSSFYPTNNPGSDLRALKPIEQTALGWFGGTRDAGELFKSASGSLADTLRPYYESFEARLERENFLHDDETRSKRTRLQLKASLAVAGLGLFKFAAAMLSGITNVWGLVILCAIGLFTIAVFGKLPRRTKLGDAYLKRLQLAFDRLKTPQGFINTNPTASPVHHPQPTFAAVDPILLSVGVFGGAALAGTIYDDYNHAFQKANQSAASSSSCGSGCGSSSGGGDGGSGGSCGGGGCGGCGGGCGG